MRILYFGLARDHAGVDAEELPLEEPISVDELWERLIERRPRLAACREISRVAVDMTYASDQSLVSDAAEVAIIPPVAGG